VLFSKTVIKNSVNKNVYSKLSKSYLKSLNLYYLKSPNCLDHLKSPGLHHLPVAVPTIAAGFLVLFVLVLPPGLSFACLHSRQEIR
jgi:hypothetical protein